VQGAGAADPNANEGESIQFRVFKAIINNIDASSSGSANVSEAQIARACEASGINFNN